MDSDVRASVTVTHFRSPAISSRFTGGLTLVGLAAALYAILAGPAQAMPAEAKIWMVAWLVLSTMLILVVTPRNFVVGYLSGLLSMLVGWRIAASYGIPAVELPLFLAFAAFVLQFFDCARAYGADRKRPAINADAWHLVFLRIYIGFDMVPHFTEKLFSGPGPFMEDVKAFAAFGLPWPEVFVLVGGLCELGIAIGIGMGLFTRFAAVCATLYFMIATVIGGHFGLGFIWASPGGGWEYPVLMMVLFLGFAHAGGGHFSLDRVLAERRDQGLRASDQVVKIRP